MRVTLVLTHQCNLGCDYCFAGKKFRRAMPLQVAYRAMVLAFQGAPDEVIQIGFFGGEPMLEFALMLRITRVAVRLARSRGRQVQFSITCNGTVMEPRHLDFFQSYGFHVAISVDGWGANHDRHRRFVGGRSSSALVWRNLERAAERLPRLHVMTVVNPDTVEGLLTLVEKLYRLGLGSLSLLPNFGADWSPPARARVREVYSRLAEFTFATYLTDEPFILGPFSELHPGWKAAPARCSFGAQDVAVSPVGNLYPCVRLVETDSNPAVRIGDVLRGKQESARAELLLKTDGCGDQCRCVGLAPGAGSRDLENQRFFALLAREATAAAYLCLEELDA